MKEEVVVEARRLVLPTQRHPHFPDARLDLGARLLFVCVAAGVLLAVDALTSLDISFVLVLLGALAASLPLSALTLRKLRRTINADIEAVDRTRSIKKRGPAAGRPGTDKP